MVATASSAIWAGLQIATTGVAVIDTTAIATTGAAAISGGAVFSWVAIGLTAVLITTAGGIVLYRRYKKNRLKGPQPLEVISLITKLKARDRRRSDGQEHECSSAMLKTAQELDQLTIEICCPGAEMKDRMNDVIRIMKRGQEEVGVDFHGSVQEYDYAINILAMCEHFNAILDLPDKTHDTGETGYYCTLLKSAELEFRRQHLDDNAVISDVTITTELFGVDVRYTGELRPALRSVYTAACYLVDVRRKDGRVVSCRKSAKDFEQLHADLIQVHPAVRCLALPKRNVMRAKLDDARIYGRYMNDVIALTRSTEPNVESTQLLDTYLSHLQEVNVDETLRAFVYDAVYEDV
mmetsp:Transcript_10790/g.28807  ORF Transcript_10790/g.28807 Transcript_10790/m.28807 type:complete len:351 (-) Transcript_10790:304-1356(-)